MISVLCITIVLLQSYYYVVGIGLVAEIAKPNKPKFLP